MKVIFLQDVSKVAKTGEVKEVASGYGRNYLIPKGLAVLANSPASIRYTQLKTKFRDQADIQAELAGLAEQLEGQEITLKARVGAKDKLFGSITSADIASELQSATGLAVDKRKVDLAEPIHKLGSYNIAVKLAKDTIPKIKVIVTEENAD